MSFNPITSSKFLYLHVEQTQFARVFGKCSSWLIQSAHNINKIAIPALALLAFSNLPGVEGGPMAYGICVEACFAAFVWAPPLLPACTIACIPLLTAPTP